MASRICLLTFRQCPNRAGASGRTEASRREVPFGRLAGTELWQVSRHTPFLDNAHHDSGPGTGFPVAPDSASAIQFLAKSDREQHTGGHGFGRLIGVPTRPFPGGRNPVGQCEVPIDLLPPGTRGDSSRRSVQETGTESAQVPPHRCLCGGNQTANSIAARGTSFLPAHALRPLTRQGPAPGSWLDRATSCVACSRAGATGEIASEACRVRQDRFPGSPHGGITRAFQTTHFWVNKTGSHASLGVSPPRQTDLSVIRQIVAGSIANCKPRSAKGRVRPCCWPAPLRPRCTGPSGETGPPQPASGA